MENKRYKSPKLAGWIVRRVTNKQEKISVAGDIEEEYIEIKKRNGNIRAFIWYLMHILILIFTFTINSILWSSIMLKNYLKIALRNLVRFKGFSFINILGLTLGTACFCLIFLYVSFELSFDKYHKDSGRIFRAAMKIKADTDEFNLALTSVPLIPELKDNFPEVEEGVRIRIRPDCDIKANGKFFYEKALMFADEEIFKIFDIPFAEGNPGTALNSPQKIVISEKLAEKYFGSLNVLGKRLTVYEKDYEISGILKNCRKNTHLKYDLIVSLENLGRYISSGNWSEAGFYGYIKLSEDTDAADFESKIRLIANDYIKGKQKTNVREISYFLQPIGDIHLNSHLSHEIEPPGNPVYVKILIAVAVLVLLIACMNFTNLSTAVISSRMKEIGVRKVMGVRKIQIIRQYIIEYMFTAVIAFILAVIILLILLPHFGNLAGLDLTTADLLQQKTLILTLFLIPLIALAAGGYPALHISRLDPVNILRGNIVFGKTRGILRKFFVFLQFAISIILIISTISVFKQIAFMKNIPLGFETEQKLVIPFTDKNSLIKNYESIKNEFSNITGVRGVTVSSSVPGKQFFEIGIGVIDETKEKIQKSAFLFIDYDFIKEFNIQMISGRSFEKDNPADFKYPVLINETAARVFGWNTAEEAVGKKIAIGLYDAKNEIIGVTEDFHFEGLQSEVKPLIVDILPYLFSMVTVTVEPDNIEKTLNLLKLKWKKMYPGTPMEYFFLDTEFEKQYAGEKRISKICLIFTVIGIFIACLGLLGLITFLTERKRKEIGIRKVLGASVPGIINLLSMELLSLVIFSCLIAWPVSYYAVNKWLQDFTYRFSPGILNFIIPSLLVLIAAVITISLKTIKAASANPVESIRYE